MRTAVFSALCLLSPLHPSLASTITVLPDTTLGGFYFSPGDTGKFLPDPYATAASNSSTFYTPNQSHIAPYSEVTFAGVDTTLNASGGIIIETYTAYAPIIIVAGDVFASASASLNNTSSTAAIDLAGDISKGATLTYEASAVPLPPSALLFAFALFGLAIITRHTR